MALYKIEKNQELVKKIKNVNELLAAEALGFECGFKINSSSMPGAILLHEAARSCSYELCRFLITERNQDVNILDDDKCSPLGYVVNDERIYEAKNGYISTVDCGSEQISLITTTIQLFLDLGGVSIYNGETLPLSKISNYLDFLKSI